MEGETVENIYPELSKPILPKEPVYLHLVTKKCTECGNTFQQNSVRQKFCSFQCQTVYHQKRYNQKFGETKSKICIICGKEFLPKMRGEHIVFCSPECRTKERRKLKLARPVIREYFFERANFTCEECGAIKTHFECHHIIPIYKGGKDTAKNIKVLCDKCHKKAHGVR